MFANAPAPTAGSSVPRIPLTDHPNPAFHTKNKQSKRRLRSRDCLPFYFSTTLPGAIRARRHNRVPAYPCKWFEQSILTDLGPNSIHVFSGLTMVTPLWSTRSCKCVPA